jgi:hypothetical protein
MLDAVLPEEFELGLVPAADAYQDDILFFKGSFLNKNPKEILVGGRMEIVDKVWMGVEDD